MKPTSTLQSTTSRLLFLAASVSMVFTASSIKGAIPNSSIWISILPASIFDRSRMSLINPSQMPRGTQDAIEGLYFILPIEVAGVFAQHLGNANDGVERRAQLV